MGFSRLLSQDVSPSRAPQGVFGRNGASPAILSQISSHLVAYKMMAGLDLSSLCSQISEVTPYLRCLVEEGEGDRVVQDESGKSRLLVLCKKAAWLHWVLLGQVSSREHSRMHELASRVFIAVL